MTKIIDYAARSALLESLQSPASVLEELSSRAVELPIPDWTRPGWATGTDRDYDYVSWDRPSSESDIWSTEVCNNQPTSTMVGLVQMVGLTIDGEAGVIKAEIEPVMVEVGPLRLPIPSARRLRDALNELLDAYDAAEPKS